MASTKIAKAKAQNAGDYVSHTLSKKEKRQLKKASKKSQKEEEEEVKLNLDTLEESEDEKDADSFEGTKENKKGDDDEEDIAYSDVELEADADVVPKTKLTIDNDQAIKEAYERIRIPWNKHPFDESQAITYHTKVATEITDLNDDIQRELQFVKQALDAATEGKKKLLALKVPFSRPADYFAEMVKSDAHMEKLRLKLVEEATEKKAKEEARKQRQLRKFGKQVQHETLQQRQKDKRETLEKIKSLKRQRKNNDITADEFNENISKATRPSDGLTRKKRRIQHQAQSHGSGKRRLGKNKRRRWNK